MMVVHWFDYRRTFFRFNFKFSSLSPLNMSTVSSVRVTVSLCVCVGSIEKMRERKNNQRTVEWRRQRQYFEFFAHEISS